MSLSLPTFTSSLPSLSPLSLTFPFGSNSSSTPTPTSSPTSSPTPTSTPSPTSAPTSSSTASSSTLPSSTPSSGSTASLTTPADVASQSSSTPLNPVTSAIAPESSASVVVVYTSGTVSPSPTVSGTSSQGFFANTGAVAGTFTVIGLVGIAGVIVVALFIIRRRNSRSYDEDMEFLEKTPDLSTDPPVTKAHSLDDGFTSDHGHYASPPMVLATPPAAYYPDHSYIPHPHAFSPNPSASHGYPSPYPTGYTQDYTAQYTYSPGDYDMAYPPSAPRVDANMPNPHEFADVELDSAPAPLTQAGFPDALHPSVKLTPTVPQQWAGTRFSVDSFYTGIVTEDPPPAGQAL